MGLDSGQRSKAADAASSASGSLPTALIIGVGGLGCPVAWALAQSGRARLLLCDDDRVDESNLHRQILFSKHDVGRDKLDAAQEALTRWGAPAVDVVRGRFLPENARERVRRADVVIEGADNFGTKFLAADACYLERIPVVHGAAIRWHGTAWSVSATGRPCYRCLFEDVLPAERAPNCNEAGVMGPVVGVVGALMADLALDALLAASPEAGTGQRHGIIHTFEGKTDRLRAVPVSPRRDCALCGDSPEITEVSEARYWGRTPAAHCGPPGPLHPQPH